MVTGNTGNNGTKKAQAADRGAGRQALIVVVTTLIGGGLALPTPATGAEAVKSAQAETASQAQSGAVTLDTLHVEGENRPVQGYHTSRSTTATKTDTPLVDIPQSVTVIPRELVQDLSMQSVADAVRYVPGMGTAQGEGNRDNPIFRGNQSTADLFVDGIRDDVEYFRDFYNIDRIEVLKGPSGMIFGRGGVGGVLNRVTRQANGENIRELSLEGGSWKHRRVTADAGQGFGDVFSARITGVYQNSESFRDDSFFKKAGVNPTVQLKLGDRTTVHLSYEWYDYDRTADRGIPSFNGGPSDTDTSTFFGSTAQSITSATVNLFTGVIEHEFVDNVKLVNRTRFGDYQKFYQNIYPNSAVTPQNTVQITSYNNRNNRESLFNQTDLIFDAMTGSIKHTMVAGVEYGRQVSHNQRNNGTFLYGGPIPVTTPASTAFFHYLPFSNPRETIPVLFSHITTPANTPAFNHVVTEQIAVYMQDQIEFARWIQLVLGVRYDNVKTDFHNLNVPTAATPEFIATKDGLFSPRAGLILKPQENVSFYVSYALAKLPRSGQQLASLTITNAVFDPEKWVNYEVGVKWDVSPNLSATAALYRLNRNNVIAATAVAGVSILVNGQRTDGFELGLSGQITDAWSIAGGYAWQDGKVLQTQSATVREGAKIGQVPEHTFSLWNRYNFTSQWGAGLGVIRQSKQFVATEDVLAPTNNVVLPGFTRVDAALFWSITENVRVQANNENLLNKKYFPNANSNNNITVGSPRALRASVTARF